MTARVFAVAVVLGCAGACVCPPGTVECDGECLDVSHDERNCGGCRVECSPGTLCIDSECVGRPSGGRSCASDAECDDGSFCNGREACVGGRCRETAEPTTCDDGVACTVESCSREQNACVSTPDHTRCPAATRCTGTGPSGCE